MEKDLARVKNIMAGLSEEGQRLSEAISTLRRSTSGGALNVMNGEEKPRKKEKAGGTYMETDLDTAESKDLSQVKAILSQRSLTSIPDDMNISVGTAIPPRPEYDEFIDSQVILLPYFTDYRSMGTIGRIAAFRLNFWVNTKIGRSIP